MRTFIPAGGAAAGGSTSPKSLRAKRKTQPPANGGGGAGKARPGAPNGVIDNAADLLDVGKLRLAKLNIDDVYNYRVTLQIFKPAGDPAAFGNLSAEQRVRLFFPTRQLAG